MLLAKIMIAVLVVTGLIWLLDSVWLRQRRQPNASVPVIVEYARSFFPVILIVFVIRSFIVEPFKIPSGSMMPTLLAGDFILVNKFSYGLRMPILNHTMIPVGKPQRGDVFVFHYPPDPSIDYIKRVIGLPGDKILYQDRVLYVNGQKITTESLGDYPYESQGMNYINATRLKEHLAERQHDILIDPELPSKDAEVIVPEGHYFALGDNRDNSRDSRYWGFVPEQNLVGKAFFIWWNFSEFTRIGSVVN